MQHDPFKEYILQSEPEKRDLGYAWHTAVGLQAVDGLAPSSYLIDTARKNIEGEISLARASELIESYYEEHPQSPADRTEEADKVSARIAQILSERSFVFSPAQYLSIHRRLFTGIYPHAGKMRDYNITKKEWVLNGDTVTYGGYNVLRETLDYDFSVEKEFSYKGLSMDETIGHLAHFVARLWQIHVFGEGNTRTTAVFFIQYLRTLGFQATNDTFAESAWYFRNALVRANYNNLSEGIHETTEYLELFLRNLLLGERNELHNRYMHISGAFPKPDIGPVKPDIGDKKPDIENPYPHDDILKAAGFSAKTRAHAQRMFSLFGYQTVFGRGEVMELLDIKASAASELLRKLLSAGVIASVKGMGKGKYRFAPQTLE